MLSFQRIKFTAPVIENVCQAVFSFYSFSLSSTSKIFYACTVTYTFANANKQTERKEKKIMKFLVLFKTENSIGSLFVKWRRAFSKNSNGIILLLLLTTKYIIKKKSKILVMLSHIILAIMCIIIYFTYKSIHIHIIINI